jgi:drug/metabolite transporter superfamily protein YnfA
VKDRRVDKQEIVSIQFKSPRGGLIIKTKDIKKQIIIPFQLDGFEEVKQSLGKWCQIQEVSQTKANSQSILILALIGFISVLQMTKSIDIQIAIPGIFFICVSSLAFLLFIQLSPDEFDRNVRKLSWILLVQAQGKRGLTTQWSNCLRSQA